MPDDPEYIRFASGVQGHSYLHGMEYQPQSYQPLQVLMNTIFLVLCVSLEHKSQ